VYGGAPGFGAINAQALVQTTANRDNGVQLLRTGVAPAEVIQQLNMADKGYNSRQYGVVDLQGRVAGFTGMACEDFANHRTGNVGSYTYSVQGNILTGVAVLDQAETAFTSQGCDLAEKLMLALEGGAQNGQGDTRCTELMNPVPANAAMIEVDLAGQTAGSYLRLTNARDGSVNAVAALRTQFNTWRQTHPCPQQDGGTPDAGPKDASVGDVFADRRDGGDVSVPGDASDGGAGTGGSAGAAGSSGTAGTAGAAGTGGTAGTGGSAGTGGAAGAGGATGGTSGTSGTGGAAGKGGAAGTSGSGGSGGSGGAATGGATGTGGAGATGGGAGASGSTAGTSTTGGRGGSSTTAGSGGSSADDGGCSCRIGRNDSSRTATLFLSGLSLIAAARSRRSKRRDNAVTHSD
jgi:uncharacterized Ntn-hydrolase superfamily protein